jgi:hypothetical protein
MSKTLTLAAIALRDIENYRPSKAIESLHESGAKFASKAHHDEWIFPDGSAVVRSYDGVFYDLKAALGLA